jgi:hypothetical protein
VSWDPTYKSVLDLAEVCDVPSSGRAGTASVTHVRRGWSPVPYTMIPNHLSRLPTAMS